MNILAIISFLSALGLLYVAVVPEYAQYEDDFELFIATYGKNYGTQQEMDYRRTVFDANMNLAEELNNLNPEAEFGVTKFADLTQEEMAQRMGGMVGRAEKEEDVEVYNQTSTSLKSYDINWRPYMKHIQDQGSCGSCWAFAAVATMEGRLAIKYGMTSKLSEQQALDCTGYYSSCSGGYYMDVFHYFKNEALCKAANYKYKAWKDTCYYCSGNRRVKTVWQVNNGESGLYSCLKEGPIAAYVNAYGWNLYKSGTITANQGETVQGTAAHIIVVVGFEDTYNHWVIRNSWGADWGMDGHIFLKYGYGSCDIGSGQGYPEFY